MHARDEFGDDTPYTHHGTAVLEDGIQPESNNGSVPNLKGTNFSMDILPSQQLPVSQVAVRERNYSDLFTRIPIEPAVPDETKLIHIANDLIQQYPEQIDGVRTGISIYHARVDPLLRQRRAKAVLIEARIKSVRDTNELEMPPILATKQSLQGKIKNATQSLVCKERDFHSALSNGGFYAEGEISKEAVEAAVRKAIQERVLGKDEAHEQFDESHENLLEIKTQPPLRTPLEVLKPEAPLLLKEPHKPDFKPSKSGIVGKVIEFVTTLLAAVLFGMVLGGAIANAFGICSINDLLALRSAVGCLLIFAIGPAILGFAAFGYKEVAYEICLLKHVQAAKTQYSTTLLWVMVSGLLVFSLADVSANAYLIHQASIENSTDPWAQDQGIPFPLCVIFGVIVTSALIISKIVFGRKSALSVCKMWNDYAEELTEVRTTNEEMEACYTSDLAKYDAVCERLRQEEAQLLEDEAQRAEKQRVDQERRQTEKEREDQEKLSHIERIIIATRQTNTARQNALALLDNYHAAQIELSDLQRQETEIGQQIALMLANEYPTFAEYQALAEIDLSIMRSVNDAFRSMYGHNSLVCFDAIAIGKVEAIANAPAGADPLGEIARSA